MRRFDKKTNIVNANLLAEKRYLTSKNIISENIDEVNMYETYLTEAKYNLNDESEVAEVKRMLYNLALENLPQFNSSKVGSKATSNDNRVIFTTMVLPKGFLSSTYVPLEYRGSNYEIWTNNVELMKNYLMSIGKNPDEYTFFDDKNNQLN
jgi:D-tyrosyl-tRNA(Tyr) deacylase